MNSTIQVNILENLLIFFTLFQCDISFYFLPKPFSPGMGVWHMDSKHRNPWLQNPKDVTDKNVVTQVKDRSNYLGYFSIQPLSESPLQGTPFDKEIVVCEDFNLHIIILSINFDRDLIGEMHKFE